MRGQRAMTDLARVQPGEACDVEREALFAGPVESSRRLCRGPRAVQQRQVAVMEDVEEIDERRVASAFLAVSRNLGHMDRQRPVRSEHAEPKEAHLQPAIRLTHTRDLARREREARLLAQPERLRLRKPRGTDGADPGI